MGGEVKLLREEIAVIRGGGDLATGVIQKLWHAGFRVVVLEIPKPMAIRRTIALCSAIIEKTYTVEDMEAVLVSQPEDCQAVWQEGKIPLLIDASASSLSYFHPTILVDAIIAKRNVGTNKNMAPITIALGPGFSAPEDVDVVIETMRGHNLGRLIFHGTALPNTGIPGELGGKSAERVVHAPVKGTVFHQKEIGDWVEKGEILFHIDETPVFSPLTGTLRGLIPDRFFVPKGLKSADVDPRSPEMVNCFTITDKARNLGGAVLDACFYLGNQRSLF